jgi:hypothetical protein
MGATATMSGSSGGGIFRFLAIFALVIIIGAGVMMMTHQHSARHSQLVQDISSRCNENNHQLHFHRASDDRHAYLCFLDGFFVFTIKNFSQENIEQWGDDVVTAFPRKGAKTLQDAIDYITCTKNGVPVVPCNIKGGPYSQVLPPPPVP